MLPRSPWNENQSKLFRSRLDSQINMNHELVRLSNLIYWSVLVDRFGTLYHAARGSPGKPTRLMVGLLYLKHIHKLSDEQLVHGWQEIPDSTSVARVTFKPSGRLIRVH